MPPPDKPRHRSGYSVEDTLQVYSACLTVAVTLGAYLDDVCIVGGLVPALLLDLPRREPATEPDAGGHPGTNDLDVGLALAILGDDRYAEISHRLRQEGFEPDTNDRGKVVLRWRLGGVKIRVDFLMPPSTASARSEPRSSAWSTLATSTTTSPTRTASSTTCSPRADGAGSALRIGDRDRSSSGPLATGRRPSAHRSARCLRSRHQRWLSLETRQLPARGARSPRCRHPAGSQGDQGPSLRWARRAALIRKG